MTKLLKIGNRAVNLGLVRSLQPHAAARGIGASNYKPSLIVSYTDKETADVITVNDTMLEAAAALKQAEEFLDKAIKEING